MTEAATGTQPLLRVIGVNKHFGSIQALHDVNIDIYPGEVVALLGDNGAGKSTLIKIISGSLRADSGQIIFDGAETRFDSPHESKAAGIETVYQDLSLCPNVDAVANFFMGRELTRRFLGFNILREREMLDETKRAMAEVGSKIHDFRVNVENLSGGQRQAIELGRFVHWGGKLVLLDEPFAALGVEQTRRGLDLINRVKAKGIAVVVITHNMLHAFQVADRMVVMRHGHVVGQRVATQTSPEDMIGLITGEAFRRPLERAH